jgi:hypothetical protein
VTGDDTTAPLVHEVVVRADPDHAFRTWVDRATTWWPPGHTVSGDPTAIVVEPRVGGRVVELGRDGSEHPWGEVLVWDPPARLEMRWHHVFPAAEATRLAVTFRPVDDGTLVRLEQSGWDALGADGPPRRNRTVQGWANVVGAFDRYLTESLQQTDERSEP